MVWTLVIDLIAIMESMGFGQGSFWFLLVQACLVVRCFLSLISACNGGSLASI